jgi:propanediol dehydratase large subunit
MSNEINILVFPDADEATNHGFNYNEWDTPPAKVTAIKAVIVKTGTQAGRPTIDFICEDEKGNKSVFMITARLLEMIVGAAKS